MPNSGLEKNARHVTALPTQKATWKATQIQTKPIQSKPTTHRQPTDMAKKELCECQTKSNQKVHKNARPREIKL